jgi:hypothetical protein
MEISSHRMLRNRREREIVVTGVLKQIVLGAERKLMKADIIYLASLNRGCLI